MYKIHKIISCAILLVVSVVIAQPTLIIPPKDSTIFNPTPFFDWSNESGAIQYRIQVDDSNDFSTLRIDTTTTISELTATQSLAQSDSLYTYYWRVFVENPAGDTSEVWSFGLLNKGPDLIYPGISAVIDDQTPTFIWLRQLGTQDYRIVIWGEVLPIVDDTIADTTYTCPVSLTNGSYTWDVEARDCLGYWSPVSTRSFTVSYIQPTPGWTQKESMPTGVLTPKPKYVKDGGSLVAVSGTKDGDVIYAFRGNKSKEFYIYDDVWAAKESIPFALKLNNPLKFDKKYPKKGAALYYDGVNTIYATKGGSTYEFWAYSISANAWTQKAVVPSTKKLKGGTSIAYFNGKVYLLAGGHKPTDLTNFFGYDTVTNTWTSLLGVHLSPTYKPWKDGSCLTELDGTIYALKGGDKANLFFKYDIDANTWTNIESIPITENLYGKNKKVLVKDGGAMTSGDGVIYAIKGGGANVFWKYTPSVKGTWASLESIPRLHQKSVPKTGAALAYADGKVYLLKGNNTSEFWCYVPGASTMMKIEPTASTNTSVNSENNLTVTKPLIEISPNPFTKLTSIRYTVPALGKVTLKLYSANGRLIETVNNSYLSAGTYTTNLLTANLAKGIYFLRYETIENRTELKLIMQ